MKIEIVIMSMITYLLLFNRSLTFQLTISHNIIIAVVLAFFIIVIEPLSGSLFVVPMLFILLIFIYCLKKEDGLWNIFLLITSFMLIVIVDNLTHFIFRIAGIDQIVYWPVVYMIIDYPVFFYMCKFLSKKAIEWKKKDYFQLSPKMILVVGTDLLLCMLIFAVHIAIADMSGSAAWLLLSSDVLYISYFILTFIMIHMLIKEYKTNAEMMVKQNAYDNLQEYMKQIEELYRNIRVFRHDYANIMASMSVYMNENDMEGLRVYYEKFLLPVSNQLNKEKDALAQLYNLEIIELKGLISVKINYALEMNIKITLEIVEKIAEINMNTIDLVRITGILLDNAMEACRECTEPVIMFSLIKTNQNVAMIIKNTYRKKAIDYSRIGEPGVSSKGEHRGIGLYNVRTIIRGYENVILDTEYGDKYFTQMLEIYGENQGLTE